MKLDHFDEGPLRVLREALQAYGFARAPEDPERVACFAVAEALDAALYPAKSPAKSGVCDHDVPLERPCAGCVTEHAHAVAAAREAGRRERDEEVAALRAERDISVLRAKSAEGLVDMSNREFLASRAALQAIAEILDHEGDSPLEGVRNLMQDLQDTCRERDTAIVDRDEALVTKCGAHPGGRTTCGQCFTNLEIELLAARHALVEAEKKRDHALNSKNVALDALQQSRKELNEANSTLAHFSLRPGERCEGMQSTREALKTALRYSVDLNPTTDFASPESVYQGLQSMLASVVETYRACAKEALYAVDKDEITLAEAQAEVERLTRALQSQATGALKTIDAAHAAGKREGIELAALRAGQDGRPSKCCQNTVSLIIRDIRSLLSEPEKAPEFAQPSTVQGETNPEGADALEGARERERKAAKDERVACIAELRQSEQAERNIGRHQRAEGFHGAANTLSNMRLAWDRAHDEDTRQEAEEALGPADEKFTPSVPESEVAKRIAEAVAAEREALATYLEAYAENYAHHDDESRYAWPHPADVMRQGANIVRQAQTPDTYAIRARAKGE